MYFWRKMSEEQKGYVLKLRKLEGRPWHSPPHLQNNKDKFHITAACYEHKKIIGITEKRMDDFTYRLIGELKLISDDLFAWSVLPNHYHILVETGDVKHVIVKLGKLHGRTAYEWNKEDLSRGRKVWFNMLEHGIKSERHFWATINYINHNPVKHGYVRKWTDWYYSSANEYLDEIGYENAIKIWNEYDINKMGSWDIF